MNNVAAVVVTYNRRQLLNENLTCLLAQSRPVDIIVIDNASTDGTFESLGELIDSGRINYYNTGSNLGGAGGFSFGIERAVELGYDYVWVMDDDCMPRADALERLLAAGERLGNYGFLCSKVLWKDGSVCTMNVPRRTLTKPLKDFSDGLMQAGSVFPLIRWCNPGNSREKRAEHFNRAKKYGVEKRSQVGIGRWYARLEANRPKEEKVYDEYNNTYKVKTYTYDELVADDIRAINEYNSQPHPNQKKYPGMTRWDVLCARQNPDLAPWDKAVLYRYIGFHTSTTIRNNSYLKVQYNDYRLPDPEIIARLEPRNYKVDAYYLPDHDGNIGEVYIYQNGRFIATCKPAPRYNENTAEQTDADREAYIDQAKYVAKFDKMVKEGKIGRVGILSKEQTRAINDVQAEAVEIQPEADAEDYSTYLDMKQFEADAIARV